jgi:hypothetical protein
MSINNVLAITDVVDLVAFDYKTGDVVFEVDYATQVNLAGNAERLNINGGMGGPTRISKDYGKTAAFEATFPMIGMDVLGEKLGSKVKKGATTAPQRDKLAVVSNKASLTQTPLTGTLKVYQVDSNGGRVELTAGDPATVATAYSIAAKEITVSSTIADDTILLCTYKYTTGENAMQVSLTAKDFPRYLRIIGVGVCDDESNNRVPVKFEVKRMKVSPEFQLTFSSGGEATEVTFNGDMYTHKEVVNGEIVEKYFDFIVLGDEEAEV